ncbi:g6863 [Coccomyxa elongata]
MEVAKQVIGPSMNDGNVLDNAEYLERVCAVENTHNDATSPSGCLTPSSPERVKEATKALQEERRAELREIGRRKFQEFRARRQSRGPLPPTPTSEGKPTLAQLVFKDQSQDAHDEAQLDGSKDPMIDMLLQQVSELMQEKRVLSRANEQLQRENQQLQELVGYLSYDSSDRDQA